MHCVYCGGIIDRHEIVRSVVGNREVIVRWAFCTRCDDAAVDGYTIRRFDEDGDGTGSPLYLHRAGH